MKLPKFTKETKVENPSPPSNKKYPVLMWIHGLNCAIDGRRCVGYCGAEQYASKAYQEAMGGGASSGGYFSWRLIEDYSEDFDGAIPIASGYVPSAESLRKIEDAQICLIVAHGRHDEMASFDECIAPRQEELQAMKNCICYFPEWVRNEDKGVASVNYGMEMGQHCLINQFQANLIYDDGMCYDERLPQGVTGWIKEVCSVI